jgi:hypothetical protein
MKGIQLHFATLSYISHDAIQIWSYIYAGIVFIMSVKSLMDTILLNSNVYIYTTSCTMLKIIDHGHGIDIDY